MKPFFGRGSQTRPPPAAAGEAIEEATRAAVEAHLGAIGFGGMPQAFFARIERFAGTLAKWGGQFNLTAAPGDPSELAFHIIDSLAPLLSAPHDAKLGEIFAPGQRILDLGSGAGFPALVLAAACDASFVLAESRRKRASFLSIAAGEMGLTNVAIDGARHGANDLPASFDGVSGRAFAKPALFYRAAAAALRPDGRAVLYANAGQELDLGVATVVGLVDYRSISYEIPRQGGPVRRVLGVWRKA